MLFLQRSTMNIKGTDELLKAEFCDLFNSVECSFLYKQLNSDKVGDTCETKDVKT